jgi:putative ABC transport system permease protein
LLFGLAPALETSKLGLSEELKEGGRSVTTGRERHRVRSLLVISEVALALMMLVGAGLLVRSFGRLLAVKPGFDADHLVTLRISFSSSRYANATSARSAIQELLPRLQSLPGVEGVALANDLPLEGQETTDTPVVEGAPPLKPGEQILVGMHVVNAGYFRAMGIPLLRGREFDNHDTEKSLRVAVINEAMARQFWANENPIGKKFRFFGGDGEVKDAATEVVGVVGNVKHNGLNAPDSLDAYAPFVQNPWGYAGISLRTRSDVGALIVAVRREMQAIDPNLPVHDVRTMEQVIAETTGERRTTLSLMGLFAVLALTLAAVGIYGVISYGVTQRMHEIGIRMALGAQRADIFRMIVGHSLALTLAGIVAGLAGSLAATRLLATMLFGVKPTDPLTLAGVALLLTVIACLASYVPARRAMRIDPMVALRHE